MTTEPEVPMSAEEIAHAHAVYAKQQAKGDYRGSFDSVRDMDLLDPGRLLATIAAKDREYERLDTDFRQMHVGLSAHVNEQAEIIRAVSKIVHHIGGSATLWQTVAAMESKLRDANRRASELFDELGATQNAAQAERVELETKLRLREAEARNAWPADHTRVILDFDRDGVTAMRRPEIGAEPETIRVDLNATENGGTMVIHTIYPGIGYVAVIQKWDEGKSNA